METFTYTPQKYFKYVTYNNTGNFERDFIAFSQQVYRNIETSKLKPKTKKQYKGILRNGIGLDVMTSYVFNERFITHEQYREFKSDYDNSIRLIDALKSVYPL